MIDAERILDPVRRFSYRFVYRRAPLIVIEVMELLKDALKSGKNRVAITLDIGKTRIEASIRGSHLETSWVSIPLSMLLEAEVKPDTVYMVTQEGLKPLVRYDDTTSSFYKLRHVGLGKAPTLEINGIHMHRIHGTDPWSDTLAKVRALGKLNRAVVLDTCTGLGYTAIAAARRGASLVITVEKDPNVIELASYNPWSADLELNNVVTLLGDSTEVVKHFEDETFTHIIHDPPRFNVAGELYSEEYYRELYRVLKRGGKLFHYTGEPGKHSNISILKGVKNRLIAAGFDRVSWVPEAQGFIAIKL